VSRTEASTDQRRQGFLAGPPPILALGAFVVQTLVLGLFLLFVLEESLLAGRFVSQSVWSRIVALLGGTQRPTPDGLVTELPLVSPFLTALAIILLAVALRTGAILRGHRRRMKSENDSNPGVPPLRMGDAFRESSVRTALWTVPMLLWVLLWLPASLLANPALLTLLVLTVTLTPAFTLAGWLWESLHLAFPPSPPPPVPPSRCSGPRMTVLLAMLLFSVTFVAMNWGLWFNLRIPHGDSAMYEEHLWNLIHGKGFRSYLDQGLFLGEHIQVIHVLLLPLYLLWPSHLLLELCETVALAGGAWFVFRIARRHAARSTTAPENLPQSRSESSPLPGGEGSVRSDWPAAWMAVAYLLYFPMHFLDIAIDLKTFRPIAFGIPLMLWGIDALERRRWREMSLAFVLALACKEDYAIVIAPLGLWLAVTAGWQAWTGSGQAGKNRADGSRLRSLLSHPSFVIGTATCLLATAYLAFVVKVAIPWFRDWETVHYARYFSAFGETPAEIAWTMLTRPWFTLTRFVTPGTAAYLLQVLLPLGFLGIGRITGGWGIGRGLPVLGRLLVGAPLFLLLCLNELAQETPGPVHHFHAPLIPIVVWAACASLAVSARRGLSASAEQPTTNEESRPSGDTRAALDRSLWAVCCAGMTAVFFSLSPVGISFWDSGSRTYWRTLYVPDERARQFEKIFPLIPQSARVASTDFVHPRFTHHERSYDYSDYPRKVADYLPKVPDDTDYIVIDTRHPYSEIRSPDQVRELRDSPDEWELLPVETKGYFIVLQRVRKHAPPPEPPQPEPPPPPNQ
jgi:uncharacterized membrane protein